MKTPRERRRNLCDNSQHKHGGPKLNPECGYNSINEEVRIEYNDVEEDILHLCGDCSKRVEKDAEKYGYTIHREKV